jgi:hypothetical protein
VLVEEERVTFSHGVVQIDLDAAKVLHFDADDFRMRKVTVHRHDAVQHGGAVRSEHEFFAEVCESLESMTWVLIAGGQAAQVDFRRYLDKHRPAMLARIAGWETIDHPTESQLLALARRYLGVHDRAAAPAGRA